MNSMYCEVCDKKIDVPGCINIKDAKAIHLHSHTSEWIHEAITYINSKDDDDARKLKLKLEKIQKDFIKIVEDFCPNKDKDKECVRC